MSQNNSHDPTATDRDERRWDRWGWITLIIGVLLVVWPVFLTLYSFRYPSDGWESTSASGFNDTGPYRMLRNLTGESSLLQPEDRVVAIDGRPLLDNSLPPLPSDLHVGQTVRYTIERAGQQLDVAIPIVRLTPAAMIRPLIDGFYENPGNLLFGTVLTLLAVIVFLLRPGNLAARYLFLFVAFNQGITLSVQAGLYAAIRPPWSVFLQQLYGWGWVYVFVPAIALIVLVFPIRKWPMRRFPRLTPFLFIGLPLLISIVGNALVWFGRLLPAGNALLPLTIFSIGLMLITVPTTLIHNLLTIREPLARAQMRWIALGFGLGLVLPFTLLMFNFVILGGNGNEWITRLGNMALLLLPLCLAIGILRYRLFDIDVIIRRTTSYALVTGLLALIYFGSIVVLQGLLSPFMSDATPAVVLSTLLIAALFLPVRRRVQDAIDRRFNRRRYDAEKTLAAFAATARDETDLDALLAELLRVIEVTMEPEQVSVWLRPADSPRPPGEG
jgi:hypothetical protein